MASDSSNKSAPYKRVLLKLSGEALMGDQEYGVEPRFLSALCKEIAAVSKLGTQLALVVGGGNIFRGVSGLASELGMERTSADNMGMMATVINALALKGGLENEGVQARVMSALEMPRVAETFIQRHAIEHLEAGRVIIFAAGTGNPFFTTDTAAALRAAEIGADVLMKGTKVDGVYDSDPEKNDTAKRFDRIDLSEAISRELRVLDQTALTMCRGNQIPILVFSILKRGDLTEVLQGDITKGTLIEVD
ncbi:MAG: UMP kinase [Magnetococcales bacterium]|nr:UMP kinase [Magnetococcales bacterium]